MDEARIAAFVEHVARPLTEDARLILDRIKELNIGLTQENVRKVCLMLGLWHITGELIRAATYIGITWIVCQTLRVLVF